MVNYKMSGMTLNRKHAAKNMSVNFPVSKEENYGVCWLTVKTKVTVMGQYETQERTLVRVRKLESLLSWLCHQPSVT